MYWTTTTSMPNSNHNARRGELCRGETWISGTIDWECSSNLSLMSILSYVVHSTIETGNMYVIKWPVNVWLGDLRSIPHKLSHFSKKLKILLIYILDRILYYNHKNIFLIIIKDASIQRLFKVAFIYLKWLENSIATNSFKGQHQELVGMFVCPLLKTSFLNEPFPTKYRQIGVPT